MIRFRACLLFAALFAFSVPRLPAQGSVTASTNPTGLATLTWNSAATYPQNALVIYNGTSYISLVASNTNNTPSASSTFWAVLGQQNGGPGGSLAVPTSSGTIVKTNGSSTSLSPATPGSASDPTSTTGDYALPAQVVLANKNGMVAQHRAGALSASDIANGITCDANVNYTTTAGDTFGTYTASVPGTDNSQLVSMSLASGTDNGSTIQAINTALYGTPGTSPILPTIEQNPQAGGTNVLRLPNNCVFASSQSLADPAGIDLQGSNTVFVYTGTGSAITDVSTNEHNLPGRAKTKISGLTIIYAGPAWNDSTAAFAGIYSAGSNELTLDNLHVYGFPTGIAGEGIEYMHCSNIDLGHNRVGIELYGLQQGGAALDNRCYDVKARTNEIGIWQHTSAAVKWIGGTLSYNSLQNVLWGGLLPPIINGGTATGGACTANATIPLTVTDSSGGSGAELVYVTNSAGTGGSVYSIYGGTYTANTTASTLTITAPSTGSLSCSTQPTFTGQIRTMTSAYAMVPSTLSNGSVGSSYNSLSYFDIEAFGIPSITSNVGRPDSGRVVYGDSTSSNNRVDHNDFYIDGTGYTHAAVVEFHGQNNRVGDNSGISGTDVWDGTTCPYLGSGANSILLDTPKPGEPVAAACDLSLGLLNGSKQYYQLSDIGGVRFDVRGQIARMAVPVQSSDPGNSTVTFTMSFPGGSGGVAPTANFAGQPSGSGISDGGASCTGVWRFSGYTSDGKAATPQNRLYYAYAMCGIDYSGKTQFYFSNAKTFGAEAWGPAPVFGGDVYATNQAAASGTRYACINTAGQIVSSVTPCSGS